ncbi:unnamed protein product [Cuscuta epithymum]|uniref:Uncharacterized protein n=1 Tax=Cuscuta epithymum TaxID=186058 RepID=A0AAV0EZS8_9ASTE|nr:unnamed protein product [Cuscuta epithymum]
MFPYPLPYTESPGPAGRLSNQARLMFSVKRQRFLTSSFLIGLTRRWICTNMGPTVMSFGDGSHGALGLPMSTMGLGFDAYEPTPIPCLPRDVTSIAAGHFHSLAVTRKGHVYAWGRNLEAQLGRDPLSPRSGSIEDVGMLFTQSLLL